MPVRTWEIEWPSIVISYAISTLPARCINAKARRAGIAPYRHRLCAPSVEKEK